jgi:hypothetical protein
VGQAPSLLRRLPVRNPIIAGGIPNPLIWLAAEGEEDAVKPDIGGKFSERCGVVSMLVTWLI